MEEKEESGVRHAHGEGVRGYPYQRTRLLTFSFPFSLFPFGRHHFVVNRISLFLFSPSKFRVQIGPNVTVFFSSSILPMKITIYIYQYNPNSLNIFVLY